MSGFESVRLSGSEGQKRPFLVGILQSMKAIKVDEAHRVRIPELNPGEYYAVEWSDVRVTLTKLTREEYPEENGPIALTRLEDGCALRLGVYKTRLTADEFEELAKEVAKCKAQSLKQPAGELGS